MNKKRPIAWLLAAAVSVMQLMPSFSLIAYAEGEEHCTITVSTAECSLDGESPNTAEIDITLSENTGLNGLAVLVDYNDTVMKCVNVTEYGLFGKDKQGDAYLGNPSTEKKGFTLNWHNNDQTITETGKLATLTFELNEKAINGDYAVSLELNDHFRQDSSKTPLDPDFFIDVNTELQNGKITVTGGSKLPYEGEIPTPPVISEETTAGFSVEVSDGCEYTYSVFEITDFSDCTWHTEKTITGLAPGTKYYVYQRVAATETHMPSDPSSAAEANTLKLKLTDIIESVSIGDNGVIDTVLTPAIKYKEGYSAEFIGKITYSWLGTTSTDPNITLAPTYTVTVDDAAARKEIRVGIAAEKCDGIIYSNTVVAGKPPCPIPPEKPIIKDIVSDGFTLAEMVENEYEYIISDVNSTDGKVWADLDRDIVVTGLNPGDVKYVFIRIKETETHNASIASSAEVHIKNGNTDLASLTVSNGTLTPAFEPDELNYTVKLPHGSSVPTVDAIASDSKATVEIAQAVDFVTNNTASVTVTAENGFDTKTYTVTFTEIDATLSNLTVNDITVNGFLPEKTGYTYSISYAQWAENKKRIYTINAVPSKPDSQVEISDNNFELINDDPDIISRRPVDITVTAATGDKSVYTITFEVAACMHLETDMQTVDSTCTELGKRNTVCLTCGKILNTEEVPALGHDLSITGETRVEPGCITEGLTVYKCSRCGYEHERTIAPLGHVRGETVETLATCTENGERIVKCERCFEEISHEIIPSLGHNWSSWTKINDTTYERTCLNNCGETETRILPYIDHIHVFDKNDVIIKEPTCTETGLRRIYCSFEGCTEYIEESTARAAHIPFTETNEPTCTVPGKTVTKCSECGTLISEQEIAVLGHSFVNYTDTATCTESGIRTADCERGCGAVDFEPIPAKGHQYGGWISGGAEGHYKVCTVCSSRSDMVGHNSDGGKVTVQATETHLGERTYTCMDCGYIIKTETVDKLKPDHTHSFVTEWSYDKTGHWHECSGCPLTSDYGNHRMDDGVITKNPTETETGIKTYSCTICDYMVTETIPVKDPGHTSHTYDTYWHYNGASHWHECTVCGQRSDTENHIENGGVTTVPATETANGSKTYSCTVCGYVTRTVTIPAIGSTPTPTPTPAPSDTVYYQNVMPPVSSGVVWDEPYIRGNAEKSGWNTIISEINSASDGERIRVIMNGSVELPKEVTEQLQNKNITLELDMDGKAIWKINGQDVTDPQMVNLKVSTSSRKIPEAVMDSLTSELTPIQFRLYHNGDFGFKATLVLSLGKRYEGMYGTLYHYNTSTKQTEFIDECLIENRKTSFELTHASYYAAAFNSYAMREDVSAAAGTTSNAVPIDFAVPFTGGVTIPAARLPQIRKFSNKKRRYMILRKRRLEDLVFVF